jgi:aminoglycoside phosphotransferase (APT) family kinase protein
MGGEIMEIECAVLPKIASQLSLPVPDFQYFGERSDDYIWKYVGYPFIHGTTSENLIWTTEERSNAASVLGKFLNGLHGIPVTDDLKTALPPDLIDRADRDAILRRIDKYLPQIQEAYPERMAWASELRDLAHSISKYVKAEAHLCVVHGDLYPRHVLANEQKQVAGIIDWGDVHFGHPFLDLSIAYTFLEPMERSAFWSAYGLPVAEEEKIMARLKAINYALALYLYGRHSSDRNLLALCDQIAIRATST